MQTDTEILQRCFLLGKQAAAKGNSAVGAILICNDKIIAEAEEAATSQNDVTCHAEMEGLRLAVRILQTKDLSNCILYSSHEPCIMCAYAIRFYRVGKVVFSITPGTPASATSGMPLLTSCEVPAHWSSPPLIVQIPASVSQ